jgi:hypothetical protein
MIWTLELPCIHTSGLQVKDHCLTGQAKKEDSPTLFSLMGQCFQDICLTEWTNIVGKQCPDKTYLKKKTFNECSWDYLDLEAVDGFPNIGNQLICWLCTAKKPAFMLVHEFTRR